MSMQIVKLLDKMQIVNIPSGLVPHGAYDNTHDYAVGDSVDYNGSSYVMYADAGAGTLPTDTTKWQVIANKGDTGAAGADSVVPGPAGTNGTNGTNGVGVPAAGTTGQVLKKHSDTDYDTEWGTPAATGATTALDNLTSVAINTSLISDTDSTDDLGSSTKYWANTFTDKLYLNATAYMDGATGGAIKVPGDFYAGGSSRVKIGSDSATQGTISEVGGYLRIRNTHLEFWDSKYIDYRGAGGATQHKIDGGTSGVVFNELGLATADTRIEGDTEQNLFFLDASADLLYMGGNSATTSASVAKGGVIYPVQAPTASAPTYVKGGIYFDTTLNKLRVGGATAWETVTSA